MWLEQLRKAKVIDATAYAMGCYIQSSSNLSTSVGTLCALSVQALKNGHTCLDCNNLLIQFPSLSNFSDLLEQIELGCLNDHPYIGQDGTFQRTLFTYSAPYLFTNKFFVLENKLIKLLAFRLNSTQLVVESSKPQQLADLCFNKPLTVLSGGPGTGKTTVFAQALPIWIRRYQLAYNKNPLIILCAPTGKAAARMNESWQIHKNIIAGDTPQLHLNTPLPEQAITVHRLLSINPITRHAHYNTFNPLAVDLLIIDEASMLDLPIFVKVLEALPDTAHILLIGDQQQLPAIEAGNILGSLLDANSNHWFFKQLHTAHLHLTQNFRQQKNPGLSQFAEDCLTKSPSPLINNLSNDLYPMLTWSVNNRETLLNLLDYASKKYAEIINCSNIEQALLKVSSFIILTAVRDGPSGCIAINDEITRRLNPNFQAYYHGQVLLITENARHLNLANGDTVIIWLDEQTLKAYFKFNDIVHSLTLDALPRHEPAYALTIHKSQGSEYDEVFVVLPSYESSVLSRSLFYTGITRARQKLHLIANQDSLLACLNNTAMRVNGLQQLAEKLVQDKIQ